MLYFNCANENLTRFSIVFSPCEVSNYVQILNHCPSVKGFIWLWHRLAHFWTKWAGSCVKMNYSQNGAASQLTNPVFKTPLRVSLPRKWDRPPGTRSPCQFHPVYFESGLTVCFLLLFWSGVPNSDDNCVYNQNPYQWDTDDDGFGDECDNCRYIFNPSQVQILNYPHRTTNKNYTVQKNLIYNKTATYP